ncbi:hypothetical protein F53441_12203, partial [Fusarium austroafricanum]
MASEWDMKYSAQQQLDFIVEWEQDNPGPRSHVPPIIKDLLTIRDHLEAVALGHTTFSEQSIAESLKRKRLFHPSFDLTQDELGHDIYSDEGAGVSPKSEIALKREQEKKAQLSKAISEARRHLNLADVDHILKARSQDASQSTSSQVEALEATAKGPEPAKVETAENETVPAELPATTMADLPACRPIEGENVTTTEQVHEDSNCPKCSKCGNDYASAVIRCACTHHYCSDCLCELVKMSIQDLAPFPPVCCGKPLPVDANSATFDDETMLDFFSKKMANRRKTDHRSSGHQRKVPRLSLEPFLFLSPSRDKALASTTTNKVEASPEKNKQKCRLCHGLIDKDT